jgi:hypothetical protein
MRHTYSNSYVYSDRDGNSHVNCYAGSYADTLQLSWRLFTIANADGNGYSYSYSYKVHSGSAESPDSGTSPDPVGQRAYVNEQLISAPR